VQAPAPEAEVPAGDEVDGGSGEVEADLEEAGAPT
jgi:hypothetical protein